MNTEHRHQKLIVLDFDHTIYNTSLFVQTMQEEFKKHFGIGEGEFMKQRNAVKECCVVIDIDKFVHFMPHPNKEAMKDMIHKIIRLQSPSFLFFDALPFIERHKDQFDILVSTHGDMKLQTEKIRHSNLPHYVRSVVSTESKGDVMKQYIGAYSHVFFIDDKAENIDAVKKAHPDVITYFIQRPDDSPYASIPTKCECADHVVKGLDFDIE